MRIGILGSGVVARTLGQALIARDHTVTIGSRTPDNPDAHTWAAEVGGAAGDFAGAVEGAEIVINATAGLVSVEVVRPLANRLSGLTLLDCSVPLDFSNGFPPSVRHEGGRSVGEQLQEALPDTGVVKALNTMNAAVMVDPGLVPGDHTLFVCGDDATAKSAVGDLLAGFGWRPEQLLDLGDISAARATELYLPLWLRIMAATGGPVFNVEVRRGGGA